MKPFIFISVYDLRQHGIKIIMWPNQVGFGLLLKCINMKCEIIMRPNKMDMICSWFVSTWRWKITMRPKRDGYYLFWVVSTWRCKITMRPKQEGYHLFLSCINIEMQDHHETIQERTYFIFWIVSTWDARSHETKTRQTYFNSWIVSTWDVRPPHQNKKEHTFVLELYQHKVKITMGPNQGLINWVTVNVYEMCTVKLKHHRCIYLDLELYQYGMQYCHETKTRVT